MAKEKIFLLDAMALLYRAHFAFIRAPRITSKGLNTSAVFGFTNTLLEIINKEDPSHIAVVFDTSAPTFRHEQFEAYKANREAMPEDLRSAQPYVRKLLQILDVPCLQMDGYEADDLIGTISQKVDPELYDVYMVTPDKDYAQLVKDNVFLYKPNSKGGGFSVLGAAEVKETFGVRPDQIIDFLGMKGDAVDNIPGIPKIGDKTAVTLLEKYGNLETLIENVDELTMKAVKASIIEFADQGRQSKELATIMCDVPFEWDVETLKMGHANLEELMVLMQELEFRSITQRILNSKFNPVRPEPQQDLFGNSIGEQPEILVEFKGSHATIESRKHDYQLVDTAEKRQELIAKVKAAGSFCFDTETTNIDPMLAELVGLSISVETAEAFFIHFPEEMSQEEVKGILDEFAPLFLDHSLTKIGQNLKYDILVLKNYGIEVEGPMFDTMLAHYVVDPGGKHGMDAMAEELLNYTPVSIETLIGKKGKAQGTMRDVEIGPLVEYAAEDADVTLWLKEKLEDKVKGDNIFEEIEQPLMPVLAAMEFEGIRIDDKALGEYGEELGQRIEVLETEIYQLAGEEFNINSPKQLGEIMFDKLKLGKGDKQSRTKTGQYVTDEQTLGILALSHELPDRIMAYRGIKKLKSTYVDALPQLINPKTGRVHTTYSQSVAVTGRLSSNNPNLQNIPIRSADGREVRKGFIPRDENHVLLSADYSQVELRIMAALSGDEAMIEAFQQKHDIHRSSAARVFGVKMEDVTNEQRSAAKTVNFGIIYGISAFGLSQRMGISRTDAKDIIDTYFNTYSRLKGFMDECIEKARAQGFIETYFGRKRFLPDINSRNATVRSFAERNAINSPIQGTAADIIKLAMIKIDKVMKQQHLRSKMILQVHDELVFDVHKEEIDLIKALVYENMVGAVELVVPMEVEIGIGDNWLQAH
ncbi:MAG: DNA polymerase I [Bacteroidia bacterium]|nr:DNA polymerase I [Bacteroidia bacterium]